MLGLYPWLRPLLFQLDPETSHRLVLNGLKWAPKAVFKTVPSHPVQAMGLTFPHPVGLAAGLDKNGAHIDDLAKLGFSFIEVGTVTPKPQKGNPIPRLFRLPSASALINRMGFNNDGVDVLVDHLKRTQYEGIVGINIGKNKQTPLSNAVDDYLYCLERVYPFADYVTINISSPNTPELRDLQQGAYLEDLLKALVSHREKLKKKYQKHTPMMVKVSPDENENTLKIFAQLISSHEIEGVIATNTTTDHQAVSHLPHGNEMGGLSGQPLSERSTQCLAKLRSFLGKEVCLVGVGGIMDAATAQNKFNAGAQLVQLYTGLIYKGPKLIQEVALVTQGNSG